MFRGRGRPARKVNGIDGWANGVLASSDAQAVRTRGPGDPLHDAPGNGAALRPDYGVAGVLVQREGIGCRSGDGLGNPW